MNRFNSEWVRPIVDQLIPIIELYIWKAGGEKANKLVNNLGLFEDVFYDMAENLLKMLETMVTIKLPADRLRGVTALLDKIGGKQVVGEGLVKYIPCVLAPPEPHEDEVVFFNPGYALDDEQLACLFEVLGLYSQPVAQLEAYRLNPSLAKTHPNVSQFRTSNGAWCSVYVTSTLDDGEPFVWISGINQKGAKYGSHLWFVGVRRSTNVSL